ncbi:MAG: DUF2997 domain-containing protein [Cylindrospermopsis raciborskii KL1]|jgi:hypothetical protein|uniref:DUF2997 domain-containing protein n=1 Tax=Cylindrospermopsis raciborskii TaxID=77022 RepID=UPI001A18A11A|nr:DUF2997 domain-containing protein [Cylindrospermopsis raciborskii]MBG0744853.1 DUF2997 domain-containing protein [Cylindrospermopsis raciborskii KL1]
MAEYQRIEYRINKEGKIIEKVLNATGSNCIETTKHIETLLGQVETRELLPEYHQQPETNQESIINTQQSVTGT